MKFQIILIYAALVAATVMTVSCSTEGKSETYPKDDLGALFDYVISRENRVTPNKHIFIVAHRANTYEGTVNNVPDNSLANIALAIKHKVDMVELDVRTTKDSVLVLCHNSTVDASTTGKGRVDTMTFAQIRSFDTQKNGQVYYDASGMTEKMPTLREALELCHNKVYVNLDIKSASLHQVIATLDSCDMKHQVMLFTGDAAEAAAIDPTVFVHPYVASADDLAQYTGYPSVKLVQYGSRMYLAENKDLAKQIMERGYLSYSNFLGFEKSLLVKDYLVIDRLISTGTDFVQTDYGELLDEYLRKKGLR